MSDLKDSTFNVQEFLTFAIAPAIIGLLTLFAWLIEKFYLNSLNLGSLSINPSFLSATIATIGVLLGGFQRFVAGLKDVSKGRITVNVFLTLAIFITLLVGEFVSAAAIIFIMSVVGSLEAYTLDKTRKSIHSLLDLTPKTANIRRGDIELTISVDELQIGDVVVVRPGERIPVDGIIIEGYGVVNQAPITGESMPVEKFKGNEVFAGTLNETGRLEIKTTKIGSDTTLARIVHLVEEAQESKAPVQNVADKFTTFFLPTVLLIAILGYFLTQNIKVAVSVLLVACPCAFAIATPSAVAAGISNMARRAVLIKGGIFFELMGKIKTIVIDKTGTLTLGKPNVVEVISCMGFSNEDVIKLAAIAEKYSEHPLAKAIIKFAKQLKLEILEPEYFKIEAGMGVEAVYGNDRIYVGRELYLNTKGIKITEDIKQAAKYQISLGRTVIHVAIKDSVIGIISIEDEIKAETVEAISALKNLGIKEIIMLTGDNEKTAKSVSKRIGIDKFYAELLPQDKQSIVKKLKEENRLVAMIGDGINDAPALALADVGVVMGSSGTDVAIEASDVTIMDDNLSRLIDFVIMSRKVLKRVKINIFLSIIYNIIGLTLAAMGHLTPLMAVIFQEAGCVSVVLSSTLLLWAKVKR